jgi:ABC-type Fe3+ transport system permease subunit
VYVGEPGPPPRWPWWKAALAAVLVFVVLPTTVAIVVAGFTLGGGR